MTLISFQGLHATLSIASRLTAFSLPNSTNSLYTVFQRQTRVFQSAAMPRAKRQPLKVVKNEVKVKAESPAKPVVSAALKKAIDTMDHMRLRLLVKNYCETMEPLREDLEKSLLVPGKKVVRYHADSDSEDDKYGEKESTSEDEIKDEDASYTREHPQRRKERKQIAVADDEMVPRYAAASVARLNSTSQLTIGVVANGIQVFVSSILAWVIQCANTIVKAGKR